MVERDTGRNVGSVERVSRLDRSELVPVESALGRTCWPRRSLSVHRQLMTIN